MGLYFFECECELCALVRDAAVVDEARCDEGAATAVEADAPPIVVAFELSGGADAEADVCVA